MVDTVVRGRQHPDAAVAVTGYTNAGRSALLNRLAGAHTPAEDVLFATLDPLVDGVSRLHRAGHGWRTALTTPFARRSNAS